ncbi:transglycosylase SLT domain-containing protein [Methylogaea oryzae]|nr:transglycosylase SLT domain-containing protein [Methylogaea oryzae]
MQTLIRLAVAWLLLPSFPSAAADLSAQRQLFHQAEQAQAKGRRAEWVELLPRLRGYPLYPSLAADQLSGDLDNHRAIESFLDQYGWSRAASRLRRDWMEHLAELGEWRRFFAHYQEGDDKALRCLYHYGQIATGKSDEGYAGGEALWLSGNSLPKSCDLLFDRMASAGRLTRDKIWRRFQLALEHKQPQLAASIETYMGADDRRVAGFWRKVHDNPKLALTCAPLPAPGHLGGKIFVHALDRLASHDAERALGLWRGHRSQVDVAAEDAAYMERRLALALALSRHPGAYAALEALPAERDDEDVRAWRVRAALLARNWPAVLSAWQRLSAVEKNQPEWRYWQGRALEQLGESQTSKEAYGQAAQQRDFFGFLAADRIGGQYHTSHKPTVVDARDMQRLADSPPFEAVREWRWLDRDSEAQAEWFHALKRLSAQDKAVAAKLAQQWGWHSVAIATAARADTWDDLSLRFPVAYEHAVERHADRQQLDPGIVYGLIRQESAFDRNAQSAVGARGLMQIMPSTAQTIAKVLREKFTSVGLLHDPEVNVRYGTYYFKDLLERFRGNFAMAAAAYNAGPQRVHRWQPAGGTVPSDIWVEQIPFKETRHYVSTVLGNAIIYQEQLNGKGKRRIGQLLPEVPAGSSRDDDGGSGGGCF